VFSNGWIMHIDDFVHTVSSEWMHRYGEKVHKLTLAAGFSCPNRDGTLGRGGCTFCNVKSFTDPTEHLSIREQLNYGKANIGGRSKKYFAYFQSYTTTYAEVEYLRRLYDQALQEADIVGLCIGTRPDCLSRACLDLLLSYADAGYEIIVELGLQTANDQTLKRINRGHDFLSYYNTCRLARSFGLDVCTHLIIGLPDEDLDDNMNTLSKVLDAGTTALKLHPLHVVRGSAMEKQYHAGRLGILTRDEYVEVAGELIANTPKDIVYHRVSATARADQLVAPEYCIKRFPVIDAVANYLARYGAQGCAIGDFYEKNSYFAQRLNRNQ